MFYLDTLIFTQDSVEVNTTPRENKFKFINGLFIQEQFVSYSTSLISVPSTQFFLTFPSVPPGKLWEFSNKWQVKRLFGVA